MNVLSKISKEDLLRVVFLDRFTLSRRNAEQKQALLEKWTEDVLGLNLTMPSPCKCEVLFFRSLVRDDYKRLFHQIIDASGVADRVVVEDYVSKSTSYNTRASQALAESGDLIRRLELSDPIEASACAVRLIHYALIVEALDRYDFETLVLFSDMQPVEHLASLYYRDAGRKTVSLQHGLYIDYGDADTVNVINYKHQPSDHFLAWGDHTAELIKRYNPKTEVVVCGKPDIERVVGGADYAGDKEGEILAIMDQEIYQEQNIAMLRLVYDYASAAGKSVRVRFHPHNNQPYYRKVFPQLEATSEMGSPSVVVGHTSSFLFEAAGVGYPVVQFVSEIPTIPLPEERQFTDAVSLAKAMRLAREPGAAHALRGVIGCIGSQSRDRYRAFFQDGRKGKRHPKFSVIVPCFNSGLHLTKALDSTLSQTCGDLEIVIADGLSTDWTLQIAMDYAARDPRVRVFSQADTGVYDAMNKGMARATGDWVIFMGSDDQFADNTILEKIAAFADRHPEAGMIYGSVRVVGDVKWAKDGTIYDGEFTVEKIKTKNICHQAIFYRRSDLEQIGPYNLRYKLCADWDMNLKMWARKTCRYIDLVIANFNAGGASTAGTDPEFGKDFAENKKRYFQEAGALTNG